MRAQPRYDDNPCRPRHFIPPCAPMPVDEQAGRVLETGRSRLFITGAVFALAFAAIGVRLVDVTLLKGAESKLARNRTAPVAEVSRADIVDRNGQLLATTLATPSLYASPRQIADPKDTAKKLAAVLPDLNEAEIAAKLSTDKSFVWIKRQLTPRQEFEVNRLGIPGLEFEREERRVYPIGNLAAHLVGYSGIDNKGLAGVERSFDDRLKTDKSPLRLSIDLRLQNILREELTRAVTDFTALGATGIVMDVRTGEVLAMVSLPDFDPNQPGTATPETIFNRATLGAYEMGSTFKTFNTAMVLDAGTSKMNSMYDVSSPIHVGRFRISDYHTIHHPITLAEVFMHSSNIGSAKAALDAGTDRQKEFFQRLGMLKTPTIELKELAAPLYPAHWREVNTMTIAFGHGMSVSPIALATGVTAIINGGVLRPATVLKRDPADVPQGVQVISPKTSDSMRRLFRLVVEQGTGSMAAAPGYVVGGKTGTAEKVNGHSYAKKALLSSFVGAFPVQDPRYLVLAMVDEPHGNKKSFGFATGGWVSAPIASRFIQRAAPILGVAPVDENSPEIRKALLIDIPALQVKKVASH
ncbi:MAG TPA: penicillin-binding protein 2 [Stellaceae bacterium]